MELKAWIEKKEMTISALAEKAGVPYLSLWRYVKGLRKIPADVAVKIQKVTGDDVTIADMTKAYAREHREEAR